MNGGNVRSLYHAELGRSVLLGAHGLNFPVVDCCFVHMGPIGPTLLDDDDGEAPSRRWPKQSPRCFWKVPGTLLGAPCDEAPPSPPRSRFLMFELMKSHLQEEHVAPALGPGLFQAARPDMLES